MPECYVKKKNKEIEGYKSISTRSHYMLIKALPPFAAGDQLQSAVYSLGVRTAAIFGI